MNADAPTREGYRRDDTYYWPSVVTFLVEDTEFCVPRQPFIGGSRYFSEKYKLDKDESPRKVVHLDSEVTAAQFKLLLRALLPQHTKSLTTTFSKTEWLTILHLSTQWHFPTLRRFAIAYLDDKLTPLEGIRLGREAYVLPWLGKGYLSLVLRNSVITEDEAETIGHRVTNRLWIIRSMLPGIPEEDKLARGLKARQAIGEMFAEELAALHAEEAEYRRAEEALLVKVEPEKTAGTPREENAIGGGESERSNGEREEEAAQGEQSGAAHGLGLTELGEALDEITSSKEKVTHIEDRKVERGGRAKMQGANGEA